MKRLSLISLLEIAPPGIKGLDRPGGMQRNPSVDVLGKKLQALVAQLNQSQDPQQKAQVAQQMQQILSQIATGAQTGGI